MQTQRSVTGALGLGSPRPRPRPRLRKAGLWPALLAAALVLSPGGLLAAVRAVGPIELTVGALEPMATFFTEVLNFARGQESTSPPGAADALLDLPGTHLRSVELQLGAERLILTEHQVQPGRPIPPDSRSQDHWFQHVAIVVSDMDAAYQQLRRAGVKHVSTGPQTLPAWNPDAGGIRAFYFRTPEDHVLEVIWFPPGKGDPRWQRRAKTASGESPLFLGIDHTAIVVSDTAASLDFYTNTLGLRIAGRAENYGPEQEHLNQVFGARVRITALRAERGPGIEFLEYLAPPGGRPLPADARLNDRVAWRTHLLVDEPITIPDSGGRPAPRPVSPRWSNGAFVVRDRDGHALQLHLDATPAAPAAHAQGWIKLREKRRTQGVGLGRGASFSSSPPDPSSIP